MVNDNITSFFSKFVISHHDSTILSRDDLFKRLDAGLKGKVTLICAPAGYGKTALVQGWLRKRNLAAIEVSFLSDDLCCFPREGSADVYVFDNFEKLSASADHEKFRFLARDLPKQANIILIGREEFPYSLSSLRLSGRLNEIRVRDLKLSKDEITEWFKHFSDTSLSEENVGLLERASEGWPLAVRLAAQFLNPKQLGGKAFQFPGLHTYFMEEVFRPLPTEWQTFLLKTSVLERMNPDLCNAATRDEDGRAMLEKIDRAHLFLSGDNHQKGFLRYHPMFSGFLTSEYASRFNHREQLDLHRRVSHEFFEQDCFEEAIEHALKGKDYEVASLWINKHAPELFKRGEWAVLKRWTDAFSEQSQELCVIRGWVEALAGNFKKAASYLNEVNQENKNLFVEKTVAEGYLALCQLDPERALEKLQEARNSGPGVSRYLQKGIELSLGEVQFIKGRFGMGGRLNKINKLYAGVIEIWKHSGMAIVGYDLAVMAELYYEQDRCDEAMDLVMKGMELGRRHENISALVSTHFIFIYLKWEEGRIHEVWSILEDLKRKVQQYRNASHWLSVIKAFEIRLTLREKDLAVEAIDEWISANGSLESAEDFCNEFAGLTFARALMFRKKYSLALRVLRSWNKAAEREDRIGSRIEILILEALIFQKRGNLSKAFEKIREALILGEPEGYIRSFLDEGISLAGLLAAALKKDDELRRHQSLVAYSKKLLELFDEALGIGYWSRCNQSLAEPLTQRELDILRGIVEGLNNSSIAGQLGIKVGTVKSHVVNLYGKLGVDGRTQAARKAQELGVIRE